MTSIDAERERLRTDVRNWKRWGPYVSERAWGTVREDYGPDQNRTWDYLPHDHARSRAYRWSEDGLAGICDEPQLLCLAFAFWNGRDPILARVRVRNAGPEQATLDVLPTLWFRNTWSWGLDDRKPKLSAKEGRVLVGGYRFGDRILVGGGEPDLLFCENESNSRRLWNWDGGTAYPKDGINDHMGTGLD